MKKIYIICELVYDINTEKISLVEWCEPYPTLKIAEGKLTDIFILGFSINKQFTILTKYVKE